MCFDGQVYDDATGDRLGQTDIMSYRGRMVDIVLTIAHLDHDPSNNDPDNLRALCQQCHNRHDVEHRRQSRRSRKAVRDLFETERAS